ncbi:OmpA family protein [Geomonas sp. Red32]|uniref:OmpA family protein n=1 Tax=Geomonas sp. Red32 TaxID=2912856 RepID=UPI00202CBC87|nr:OmpA family protein [Geomonas sp. Red32]MCM0080749.1 OmpA family protein [Geomonas sp. Red32]
MILEAELVGTYIRARYRATDRHFNTWGYRADFLYNFMPHSAVVPYLAAGGGGLSIEYPTNRSVTDGVVDAGLGVKFFMGDSVALRLDGRHIFDISYKTLHNWEYSLGLTFVMGGREARAERAETPAEAGGEQQPQEVPASEPEQGHYKYCITLRTHFDIDRAIIRPEDREEVARVGDFMKRFPSTTAIIEGHTDNQGSAAHNMDLSLRRAQAVVNYLVDNYGIDRSRLTARGYGLTRPVADNATDEGRQQNRRIEAIIDCAFDVKQDTPPERLCMGLIIDFASGSAEIRPEYRDEIAKVADYMKAYPSTTAVIEGHTDNIGGFDENMRLSQRRAESVVNYLVDNFGIDRSRLSAKGYGYTRRIAYDDTSEGRRKNRRINAIIDCVIKR